MLCRVGPARRLWPKAVAAMAKRSSPAFLSIAGGSASELEYQLLLAHDLAHLPRDPHAELTEQVGEVKRMLYRFMQSLSSNA